MASSSNDSLATEANPSDPNTPSTPPQPTNRTKTITPTTSESANPGKVKALIVIDDSGSMGGSQQNLSATIDPLLVELEKFNAEVRIASTTFGGEDCPTSTSSDCGSNPTPATVCSQNALFSYSVNYCRRKNPDGSETITSRQQQSLKQTTDFKYVEGTTQNQKQAVSLTIKSTITNLGTKGSDSESPFAAVLVNTIDLDFFKVNDKALIFVVTDEDDSGSLSKMLSQKTFESQSIHTTTKSPGIAVRYTGFGYSGYCNGTGENNTGAGPRFGGIVSQTLAGCQEFLANLNSPNCSYSCQSRVEDSPSNGDGHPLESRSFDEACAYYSANPRPTHKFDSCISREASTVTVSNEISSRTLHLGLDEATHGAVSAMPLDQKKNFFVQKLKDRLSARVGEKYLIQVATNIANQSCGLNGQFQSNDRFFQSIANQFPVQNFKVSSICSQDGTSAESIRKLASDFISVVNSEYSLGLLPNERVVSVKLKLKNSLELVDLTKEVQYTIRNGQFVLLDPNLLQFEKIDVEIRSN